MSNPVPFGGRATLRRVDTAATTPQDLLVQLLEESDFATVADIARASGWNYQRLHRWSKGSVGAEAIPQDDLADLLVDLERRPEDYGVRPSLAWKRKRLQRGPGASLIDAAEMHRLEQLAAALDAIGARVSDIPMIVDRLSVMSDQLARIEARLPPVEETA